MLRKCGHVDSVLPARREKAQEYYRSKQIRLRRVVAVNQQKRTGFAVHQHEKEPQHKQHEADTNTQSKGWGVDIL